MFSQGHNTVAPVRLLPAAPRSQVKHSTTEPLRPFTNFGVHQQSGNVFLKIL